MSIFKRIKNLWIISGWEIATPNHHQNRKVGDSFAMLFKKNKQATIVQTNTFTDDIPNQ